MPVGTSEGKQYEEEIEHLLESMGMDEFSSADRKGRGSDLEGSHPPQDELMQIINDLRDAAKVKPDAETMMRISDNIIDYRPQGGQLYEQPTELGYRYSTNPATWTREFGMDRTGFEGMIKEAGVDSIDKVEKRFTESFKDDKIKELSRRRRRK